MQEVFSYSPTSARSRLPDQQNRHYIGDTPTSIAVKSPLEIAVKKHLASKHRGNPTTEDTEYTEEMISGLTAETIYFGRAAKYKSSRLRFKNLCALCVLCGFVVWGKKAGPRL
jgi:hypothetical protein